MTQQFQLLHFAFSFAFPFFFFAGHFLGIILAGKVFGKAFTIVGLDEERFFLGIFGSRYIFCYFLRTS